MWFKYYMCCIYCTSKWVVTAWYPNIYSASINFTSKVVVEFAQFVFKRRDIQCAQQFLCSKFPLHWLKQSFAFTEISFYACMRAVLHVLTLQAQLKIILKSFNGQWFNCTMGIFPIRWDSSFFGAIAH